MNNIEETLNSESTQAKKVAVISNAVVNKEIQPTKIIGLLKTGTEKEKELCTEVIKHIAIMSPEVLQNNVSELIEQLQHSEITVKCGIYRAIGDLSKKSSSDIIKAIPQLMVISQDDSSAVRFCAAYGFSMIAKYNRKTHRKLIPFFEKIVKREKNLSVRYLYIKLLKTIKIKKEKNIALEL